MAPYTLGGLAVLTGLAVLPFPPAFGQFRARLSMSLFSTSGTVAAAGHNV
jgi:hypothetical protein